MMPLDLIPDNRGILAILDAQVQGPYRFVHHALIPYVRIGPAHETEGITIHASAALELLQHEGAAKRLHGIGSTLDFAVMLEGVSGVRLREVPWRATALDQIDPVRRLPSAPTVRLTRARPPRRLPTPQRPMSVVPIMEPMVDPPSPEPGPSITMDRRIPEAWQALCTREDLHPELGDYVVMPRLHDMASEGMPAWVALSDHVGQIHVVKPRLGQDQVITEGEE